MTLVLTGKKCAVLPQGTYTDSSVKGLRYVVKAKQKYFIYRRTIENKPYSVYIGLIPLAQARAKASLCNGLSPSDFLETIIKPKQVGKRIPDSSEPLFKNVIKEFLEFKIKCKEWTSERTINNGYSRINNHVLPYLGEKRLEDITFSDVAKIGEGNWGNARTVAIVVGLVRECFNWAIARGIIPEGIRNPADRNGPLRYLMSSPKGGADKSNHGTIPISRIPESFQTLRKLNGSSARCFEFSILTATRSHTVRHARWENIDLDKGIWTIPSKDLKTKANGRLLIPLCPKVIDYLKTLSPKEKGYLFENSRGQTFSDNAFYTIVKRINRVAVRPFIDVEQSDREGKSVRATQHGIARAGFKTWAKNDLLGNDVKYDDKVSELCLHHKVKDIYNGAYERNSFWARRSQMMTEWADFVMQPANPTELKFEESFERILSSRRTE